LEVLREAGLVERVRGKGTFVVRRLPDLTDLTVPLRPTPPAAGVRRS
jgi:DNA-binding GntR family transcriptional regulator